MTRYRLTVEYDGAPYKGFQAQADLPTVQGEIERALTIFEPRLDATTLKVGRDPFVDAEALRVKFFIAADLRAEPMEVPVEFTAEMELDTGKIKVDRL